MALNPEDLSGIPHRTVSPRPVTHGRGGAGNIGPEEWREYVDGTLDRPPVIRGAYSTGRGGGGNIETSGDLEKARLAQDLEEPRRSTDGGNTELPAGRGGFGNIQRALHDERVHSKSPVPVERTEVHHQTEEAKVHEGFADKAKNFFHRKLADGKKEEKA
ncbi:hypothetical protein SAICODRAFT_17013 [Saitoella complicata NRRL Y-17804]|uniref:Uncharacterized protein n=1 Tax=Saitoella complicata (strain BCRC 22490 / CBS 7301 / JCM 7358 / NBRC 10748 / NRRL Y-17804) TaxID=698492 RepID=A0A0E9NBL4_SAICN|nr:uncharacterized protein SAICODRAFT_17013 [Saitoella complicata NRRL Y-17804]ODQ55252.1 hypothetical protein SAICODRAFT_17013 [Saitoella complicata NRRL Y-17804]GAO47086.1 hypothetical protein G7K_1298-t1 [Saitoella complicata NRRL Y-17804]